MFQADYWEIQAAGVLGKEVHNSIIEFDVIKKREILGKHQHVQAEEIPCIQTAATRVLAGSSHSLHTPLRDSSLIKGFNV